MSTLHVLLILLSCLVVLAAARRPLLRAVGAFLVVDDEQRPGDAIVLLNGNLSTRTFRVVELYNNRRVPILMARLADTEEVCLGVIPNITDATRELLIRRGVDEADISILSSDRWIAGTWSEAIVLCAHIRAVGYRRVTIVTDAFHTRRARWTFRRVMRDGVEFRCAATRYSLDLAGQWWRTEYGLIQVFNEYLKFAHYRRLARAAKRGPPPSEFDLPPENETRRYLAGQNDRR